MKIFRQFFSGTVLLFLFNSCLYTTHHFNTGRILEPSQSSFTMGFGTHRFYEFSCDDYEYISRPGRSYRKYSESVETHNGIRCRTIEENMIFGDPAGPDGIDSVWWDTSYSGVTASSYRIFKGSIAYRIGVREKWGPFTGVEIGYKIEAPTLPVSGEFDIKFGLPHLPRPDVRHSLSLGYGMGFWADNSLYLEYAISRAWRGHLLFANTRSTYLATQPPDQIDFLDIDGGGKFVHKRRFIQQISLGGLVSIPQIPVFPDFFVPQLNLTFPFLPADIESMELGSQWTEEEKFFDLKCNVAIGWLF